MVLKLKQVEVGKELDEANSRLYNAKQELDRKDQFQDTSILTPKEKKAIVKMDSVLGTITEIKEI